MRYIPPAPPQAAVPVPPAEKVWTGSPIERYKITLRIFGGDGFDPEYLTRVLGCRPSMAEVKGQRIVSPTGTRVAQESRWSLTVESDRQEDIEQAITSMLNRLPGDMQFWHSLTQRYYVDIYCGVHLRTSNRGFGISPQLSRMLADRNLGIGFDLYFDRAS